MLDGLSMYKWNYRCRMDYPCVNEIMYSETLNKEYIERIHQMSYSSLSDNGVLQILSFLIKWLYRTL